MAKIAFETAKSTKVRTEEILEKFRENSYVSVKTSIAEARDNGYFYAEINVDSKYIDSIKNDLVSVGYKVVVQDNDILYIDWKSV